MAAQTLQFPTARPTGVQNVPFGVDLEVVPVFCGNYTSGNAAILVGDIMVDVGIYCGNNNAASANCVPGNATTYGSATPGNAAMNNYTGLCGTATGLILTSGKTLASNATFIGATSNAASCASMQELVHDAFMGVSTTYRDVSQTTQGTVRDEIGLIQEGTVNFTLVGNSITTPGTGNGSTLDSLSGAIGAGGNLYGNNNYTAVVGLPVAVAVFNPATNNAQIVLDSNNLPCVEILGMNNATQNMAKYIIGYVAKPVATTDSQVAVNLSTTWSASGGQNVLA